MIGVVNDQYLGFRSCFLKSILPEKTTEKCVKIDVFVIEQTDR